MILKQAGKRELKILSESGFKTPTPNQSDFVKIDCARKKKKRVNVLMVSPNFEYDNYRPVDIPIYDTIYNKAKFQQIALDKFRDEVSEEELLEVLK